MQTLLSPSGIRIFATELLSSESVPLDQRANFSYMMTKGNPDIQMLKILMASFPESRVHTGFCIARDYMAQNPNNGIKIWPWQIYDDRLYLMAGWNIYKNS